MADSGSAASQQTNVFVDFATSPGQYKHWRLSIDGRVARLSLDVREDQPFFPGYDLKLNSYDLGVDIELYDAVQRLRFEHPEVGAVVITSAKDRVFCAGANIKMLGQSAHGFKVNFCKFTNETRNSMEDASAYSGQTYICAINGPAAGGGYELALACDHILLIDDGSSTVSLPELPLLAVLPGTGGLTRLVDKGAIQIDSIGGALSCAGMKCRRIQYRDEQNTSADIGDIDFSKQVFEYDWPFEFVPVIGSEGNQATLRLGFRSDHHRQWQQMISPNAVVFQRDPVVTTTWRVQIQFLGASNDACHGFPFLFEGMWCRC